RVNQQSGNKVVPTIKLAKDINYSLPENSRLSGYHIESLAVEAFRYYTGRFNPKAMLEHFFEKASQLVLNRIKDRTGQSLHVDDYLGAPNSRARKQVSNALDRVYRRMKNADAIKSRDQWMRIVGFE